MTVYNCLAMTYKRSPALVKQTDSIQLPPLSQHNQFHICCSFVDKSHLLNVVVHSVLIRVLT